MPTFSTPEPISAAISLVVGDVAVTASDRDDTVVEVHPSDPHREQDVRAAEQTRVEFAAGRLVVKAPRPRVLGVWGKVGSIDITVDLPTDSAVESDASVGGFRSTGRLGNCRLKSATGDIRLDGTGDLIVHTGAAPSRSNPSAAPPICRPVRAGSRSPTSAETLWSRTPTATTGSARSPGIYGSRPRTATSSSVAPGAT
ncbi:hypothetical protein SCD75_08315 [Prescottella equi]|nr:hypothetical protein SCD75_08315 [Prescottella equi]